jgi:hypothetical protein
VALSRNRFDELFSFDAAQFLEPLPGEGRDRVWRCLDTIDHRSDGERIIEAPFAGVPYRTLFCDECAVTFEVLGGRIVIYSITSTILFG